MRIFNHADRLVLGLGDTEGVDVATASRGRFDADVQSVYEQWDDFVSWATGFRGAADVTIEPSHLGPPVPRPRQIFGIGLNYRDHADEAGLPLPDRPMVLTKFTASVTGPGGSIVRVPGSVDFEVELVAVVGRRAQQVAASDAWDHIAGLTAGQDLSERDLQWAGSAPQQFSLSKSFTGFTPIGPALVTLAEFADPGDLRLGCLINGESMQVGRTRDMVFSIPELVAYLSGILPLLPGDLIFTGTPAGIGFTRNPKRLLEVGDELVTWVDGIGQMRHQFVAP